METTTKRNTPRRVVVHRAPLGALPRVRLLAGGRGERGPFRIFDLATDLPGIGLEGDVLRETGEGEEVAYTVFRRGEVVATPRQELVEPLLRSTATVARGVSS